MIQKDIFDTRRKLEKKARHCMFEDCQNVAISSHVLQKNGILKEISENNHLIELKPADPYKMEKEGISEFKLVGVNNVYTFPGFCSIHDSSIFKTIESSETLDLQDSEQQSLFAYRGLCQEIRRKEISLETLEDLKDKIPPDVRYLFDSLHDGYLDGLKNLTHFKKEFENCIKNKNFYRFHFETIQIPKIDVCISVPLNIGELEVRDENETYDEWKINKVIPFTTSFINVFPKGNFSYIIAGYHKDYTCKWTDNFNARVKRNKKDRLFKEISDLLTLRLEFWAMSPKLFATIRKVDFEKYKLLFADNVYDHSPKLKTKLNLFEKYTNGG